MGTIRGALLAVVALASLVACGKPTIDSTSDESLKASAQKVRNSLPAEKREEFDKAVQVLVFRNVDMSALVSGSAGDKMKDSLGSLNGKNADEILASADQVIAERKAKEKQQAIAEIAELQAKQARTVAAREELKKFEVLRSRFHLRDQEFGQKQPIIELSVKNGTSSAVAHAYFEGTIASPGRSVPWHKDTFNYGIPGGLEPGESANWSLAPNMFSDWGKVDVPSDAILTVTVERIDGADGKPIYSVDEFGERESKRLAELKSTFGL